MSGVFKRVGSLRPSRSVFDLSYEKKFTCDMGQLIPVMCDEMVPGDTFKVANSVVIRFQPLVAPMMHEVNVYVHYFFVPYRILWDGWEEFITGGVDGESALTVPRWEPLTAPVEGTLWDYMGFPTGILPAGAFPLDFPRRAYNRVYNEYYRDETLIEEVAEDNGAILMRCWEKDYFTSALPWQQRGTAPALPISGFTNAEFQWLEDGSQGYAQLGTLGLDEAAIGEKVTSEQDLNWLRSTITAGQTAFTSQLSGAAAGTSNTIRSRLDLGVASQNILSDNNVVDLSSATTFNVADLRLVFQIQKWLERNARAGARYIEFLGAHFGVHPRDERLQRPEYVGGSKSSVIVSEVLQTSSTDSTSPQGNQAGHAISGSSTFAGTYTAQEFGLMIGLMSVMPRTAYQQGIDRQWLRRTKYDFYFPEFANLSEQAIEKAEIVATDDPDENVEIWGYQGRYDEMRIKRNMVAGLMRTTFNYWHMGRIFASPPNLNAAFVRSDPTKRIFAVQDEPGLIVNFGNIIRAVRPMPIQSEPGLIDHN